MRRIIKPLLALLLLAGLVAVFLWRNASTPEPVDGLAVAVDQDGDTEVMRVILHDADQRVRWQGKGDNYLVDARRDGGDVYHLIVVMVDERKRYRVNSTVRLEPGSRTVVANFGPETRVSQEGKVQISGGRRIIVELR
ncbi:hypothetical protein ACRYJU_17105 [Alloalcanivorax xenomutans]|uniref:hypothetical protein n=1 Tax=Alloalcanivorax xenomutans TaxID=1094342 RepID=UPI000BDB664D|nr:hypothetical protein [Alloalcanivorax xenomutans]SOC04471.1 hypothetical protein SAMN05877962_106129 [Alloalcanivorax xenomutans]